jgi:hypothetical protein
MMGCNPDHPRQNNQVKVETIGIDLPKEAFGLRGVDAGDE